MTGLFQTAAPIKATRASQLTAALRQAILRGEMRPGEKVSLDRLREQHQVSLSPLREAISRLVSTGLIEMEDQRGNRIAPVSRANLEEIVALRGTLEVQALRASIAAADLDWESEVLGALHRLDRIAPEAGGTGLPAGFEAALRDFHMALVSKCGLPILLGICGMLFDLNVRYLHLFAADMAQEPGLVEARRGIARAAVERDADMAANLLDRHIAAIGTAMAPRVGA